MSLIFLYEKKSIELKKTGQSRKRSIINVKLKDHYKSVVRLVANTDLRYKKSIRLRIFNIPVWQNTRVKANYR